jgi:hypothetical protein
MTHLCTHVFVTIFIKEKIWKTILSQLRCEKQLYELKLWNTRTGILPAVKWGLSFVILIIIHGIARHCVKWNRLVTE